MKTEPWNTPLRVLLLTYNRHDHWRTTLRESVAGVRKDDAGSIGKAQRARKGDWVLIRDLSRPGLVLGPPAKVTDRPAMHHDGSSLPKLLWEEERERGLVLFPLRIPVTFDGTIPVRPERTNWKDLCDIGWRGSGGQFLDTPQRLGKKLAGNVITEPAEISALVALLLRWSS